MTELATQQRSMPAAANSMTLIFNEQNMALMFKFAEVMAQGVATVPKHLQGKPADCLAIVIQAMQWQMNPFAVAQKTHLVNGTLGYEAQLVNAVLKSTQAIDGEFAYEYDGSGTTLRCRVGAVTHGHKAITFGEWLPISQVTTKNSPLWVSNPKQQLGYLQVKNWARAFHPGAILGVYTSDELETPEPKDMGPAVIVEPVFYPAEQFADNLPKWEKVILSGRKTCDEIIAMAESKHPLSAEQKAAIQAIKVVEEVKPVVSYATVADRLHKAQNPDALDAAADLIGEVADAEQRAELTEIYNDRTANLTA